MMIIIFELELTYNIHKGLSFRKLHNEKTTTLYRIADLGRRLY